MPLISSFYGILIYIYREDGAQHNKPHFHARYSGKEAVYDFDGNLITGELPRKQNKQIEVWADLHHDELEAAWAAWHEDNAIVKIEGLK